jgi:hypothetical protein
MPSSPSSSPNLSGSLGTPGSVASRMTSFEPIGAWRREQLILRAVLIDEITTAARRFFLPQAEALSEIAPLTVVRHS